MRDIGIIEARDPYEAGKKLETYGTVGLVLVDAQRDFFEEGSLPVPQASQIIRPIEKVLHAVQGKIPCIATQDWHPAEGHISFADQHEGGIPYQTTVTLLHGGTDKEVVRLYPRHCVQNTPGAEIAVQGLFDAIILKGTLKNHECFGGFETNVGGIKTTMESELSRLHIAQNKTKTLIIAGLAANICVENTARQALERGYHVILMSDGTRGIPLEESEGSLDAPNHQKILENILQRLNATAAKTNTLVKLMDSKEILTTFSPILEVADAPIQEISSAG